MAKTIIITDPCYVEHSYGALLKEKRSTIYGDWQCMVYPGTLESNEIIIKNDGVPLPNQWDEKYFDFFKSYNWGGLDTDKKISLQEQFKTFHDEWVKKHTLGEFCADSGQVAVYDYNMLNADDKKFFEEHPWCGCIIKDFDGEIEYYVDPDNNLHVIGKSETKPFYSVQSGF
jgi:hypothetical protein